MDKFAIEEDFFELANDSPVPENANFIHHHNLPLKVLICCNGSTNATLDKLKEQMSGFITKHSPPEESPPILTVTNEISIVERESISI